MLTPTMTLSPHHFGQVGLRQKHLPIFRSLAGGMVVFYEA